MLQASAAQHLNTVITLYGLFVIQTVSEGYGYEVCIGGFYPCWSPGRFDPVEIRRKQIRAIMRNLRHQVLDVLLSELPAFLMPLHELTYDDYLEPAF